MVLRFFGLNSNEYFGYFLVSSLLIVSGRKRPPPKKKMSSPATVPQALHVPELDHSGASSVSADVVQEIPCDVCHETTGNMKSPYGRIKYGNECVSLIKKNPQTGSHEENLPIQLQSQ